MAKKELLIIIPAYNEEKNIIGVLKRLEELDISSIADIVVIDDASTDHTGRIAKGRNYEVVTHIYNLGYGSALQSGYKLAVRRDYKYVIQMDADGQHDPCNIPAIYKELREIDIDGKSPDIVLAARFMKGSSKFQVSVAKKCAYALFRFMIRRVTGRQIADPTTGLQGLGRRAFLFYSEYNHFDAQYPDTNMLMQMLLLGYRVKEIPAVMHARKSGESMHSGISPAWYMLRMLFSILAVIFRIKILRLDKAMTSERNDAG